MALDCSDVISKHEFELFVCLLQMFGKKENKKCLLLYFQKSDTCNLIP